MGIWFPGDEIRATVDGHVVTGVIEDFTHDVHALTMGLPGDTAHVRTDAGMVLVPVAELQAVA